METCAALVGTSSALNEGEIAVVQKLLARLESAKPIPVCLNSLATWLIFTDGACEENSLVGSIGGVLVAPNHRVVHHFGGDATKEVMSLLRETSQHPIHELEMIPILVSLRLWGHLMRGCQIVHYIDNESVRVGSACVEVERQLLQNRVASHIMDAESFLKTKSWYARVSSFSNLADDPSRGNFDLLTKSWEHSPTY